MLSLALRHGHGERPEKKEDGCVGMENSLSADLGSCIQGDICFIRCEKPIKFPLTSWLFCLHWGDVEETENAAKIKYEAI